MDRRNIFCGFHMYVVVIIIIIIIIQYLHYIYVGNTKNTRMYKTPTLCSLHTRNKYVSYILTPHSTSLFFWELRTTHLLYGYDVGSI